MEKTSEELKKFKEHFLANTINIKIVDTTEERSFYHWKTLIFNSLNVEEMLEIANYIIKTFSQKGKFSHLLPKLNCRDGLLALTVDEDQIKKFILKK